MAQSDGGAGEDEAGAPSDLVGVEARLSELQERKRHTVRWHMSRNTAERAIAAITATPTRPSSSGSGKSRRRKRHKRLL